MDQDAPHQRSWTSVEGLDTCLFGADPGHGTFTQHPFSGCGWTTKQGTPKTEGSRPRGFDVRTVNARFAPVWSASLKARSPSIDLGYRLGYMFHIVHSVSKQACLDSNMCQGLTMSVLVVVLVLASLASTSCLDPA